ncbi:phospholipid methyltransferase-domain-containing protein [Amanita rubescens]|nr:phospholipid methyltransferase-domain-containing protein [Amanita rubescens]
MTSAQKVLADFHRLVDVNQQSLLISLAAITFNPTAWNIVARHEYRNKTLTKSVWKPTLWMLFPRSGNFFIRYSSGPPDQPRVPLLPEPYDTIVPAALFALGQTFVITSTWALGVTGTFLGDYFGILMDHRVTGFPFNVLRDPMYVGSTMCFVATALWYERPAGLFISAYVYILYLIALQFEGPFTDMIYSKRAKAASKKAT